MATVQVKTADGIIFKIDMEIAKSFGTIQTLLEHIDTENGDNEVIPLQDINAPAFEKSLEFVNYYKNGSIPNEEEDQSGILISDNLTSWETKFVNMDVKLLMDLVRAAHYLDCTGLFMLMCKAVANLIKGKSHAEIIQTFKIGNEYE